MKRVALLALASVALGACRDDGPVTPLQPGRSGVAEIFDGNSLNRGNPSFYFLPPMVANPKATGVPNPDLHPVVQLCLQSNLARNAAGREVCTQELTHATVGSPGAAGLGAVRVVDQLYQSSWDTSVSRSQLRPGTVVRVIVYPQDGLNLPELGHADVKLVSTGRAKKGVPEKYIGLVDGRTIPITFRIEQGAVYWAQAYAAGGSPSYIPPCIDCVEQVVTSGEQTDVVTPSRFAAARFFANSLPLPPGTQVVASINRHPDPCFSEMFIPASQQDEGCYDYSTEPVLAKDFQTPVTVEVCVVGATAGYPYADHDAMYHEHGDRLFLLDQATAADLVRCDGFAAALSSPFQGNTRWDRAGRFAERRLRSAGQLLAAAFLPGELYARDQRLSGSTLNFSPIGWAKAIDIEKTSDPTSGTVGGVLNPAVKLWLGRSEHDDPLVAFTSERTAEPVTWTVTSGGGSVGTGGLQSDVTRTTTPGADGATSIEWKLGSTVGVQTLRASVRGETSWVTFTAVASAERGTRGTTGSIAVLVVNSENQPIPGAKVTLSDGHSVKAGQDGVAVFTGLDTGTYVVTVSVFGNSSVSFSYTCNPSIVCTGNSVSLGSNTDFLDVSMTVKKETP